MRFHVKVSHKISSPDATSFKMIYEVELNCMIFWTETDIHSVRNFIFCSGLPKFGRAKSWENNRKKKRIGLSIFRPVFILVLWKRSIESDPIVKVIFFGYFRIILIKRVALLSFHMRFAVDPHRFARRGSTLNDQNEFNCDLCSLFALFTMFGC